MPPWIWVLGSRSWPCVRSDDPVEPGSIVIAYRAISQFQVSLIVGKKRNIAAEKRQKKEQKEEAERHMEKLNQLVGQILGSLVRSKAPWIRLALPPPP